MIRGWGLVLIAENINHGIDKSLIQVFIMVFENWVFMFKKLYRLLKSPLYNGKTVYAHTIIWYLAEVISGQPRRRPGLKQFQSLELINRNISSRERSLSTIPETGSDFTL